MTASVSIARVNLPPEWTDAELAEYWRSRWMAALEREDDHGMAQFRLAATLDEERKAHAETKAHLAEYENTITWGVTCHGCAKQLDLQYNDMAAAAMHPVVEAAMDFIDDWQANGCMSPHLRRVLAEAVYTYRKG